MKRILLSIATLFIVFTGMCQEDLPVKFRIKKEEVYPIRVNGSFAGYLTDFKDSTIKINNKYKVYGTSISDAQIPYTGIDKIAINRAGAGGRGAKTGAITGLVVGTVIGLISYKKPSPDAWVIIDFGPGASALAGAFLGSATGAGIGALLGTIKHKFIINRNKQRFTSLRNTLTIY